MHLRVIYGSQEWEELKKYDYFKLRRTFATGLIHVFQDSIAVKYIEYTSNNEEASKQKCWAFLRSLEEPLMNKYKDGKYAKNGGFAEFQEELNAITSKYELGGGLGVKVICLFILQVLLLSNIVS